MSRPCLVLASQSPRRRELLALLGLPFRVTVVDVVEDPRANELPAALVARLSQAKARAARPEVSALLPDGAVVVASDTVVALEGDLLGKPRDADEATAMLRRLRGRPHAVHSAVTLLEAATGRVLTDVAATQVVMRAYTDAEIAAYVASGDPFDKAGAYAIQHPDFHPVAEFRGCYLNVIGLPLCHLTRCLRAWGIGPDQDIPEACQAYTGYRCQVCTTILAGKPDWMGMSK